MMRRSYFEIRIKWHLSLAAALMILLALPPPSFAHPELLSQIELLDVQLHEHPGDPGLLLKRGDLYRRHGDYDAARRDFADAGKAEPPPPDLDFFEGWLQLETSQPESALTSFNRYLAAHPGHVKTLILRADAFIALKQPAKAATDLGQAISHSQSPSPALFRQQALALVSAGAGRWPDARAVIEDGLSRFPAEVSLLGLGTDLALALDDEASARHYMSKLPAAVRELPQWQERLDLADGLAGADPAQRRALLRRAGQDLERQTSRGQAIDLLVARMPLTIRVRHGPGDRASTGPRPRPR